MTDLNVNDAIHAHKEGKLGEAEKLYCSILKNQPTNLMVRNNFSALLITLGRFDEAAANYQKIIEIKPDNAEAHNNLGVTLFKLGKFDEVEEKYRAAIKLKPDYFEAYNNLGITLKELGKLDEAEACYRTAIDLKPNYELAHNNLANTLKELGRLNEAEASYKTAIELKPNYVEALNNLGITLKELGKLDEAEVSFKKAIKLKPNYVGAYNNLGITLKKIGRLDEAEACYRTAIKLKPNYVEALNNLGLILKQFGKLDEAEANFKKAIYIKPDYSDAVINLDYLLNEKNLLVKILEEKKISEKNKHNNINSQIRLTSNPSLFKRKVEKDLISKLYQIKSMKLDDANPKYLHYGNGRTSDYQLFKNNFSIIKNVERDLTNVMKKAVNSNIFIMESFFNIFKKGSGIVPHNHLNNFDKTFKLTKQKFSLTYYLDVGDQNSSEPGALKLEDPSKEILPSEGMILIFPSGRMHSASYNGTKDRIMIGVNFYSLT